MFLPLPPPRETFDIDRETGFSQFVRQGFSTRPKEKKYIKVKIRRRYETEIKFGRLAKKTEHV